MSQGKCSGETVQFDVFLLGGVEYQSQQTCFHVIIISVFWFPLRQNRYTDIEWNYEMLLKEKKLCRKSQILLLHNCFKFFVFYWYFLRQVLEDADCPGQKESFQVEGNSNENLKILLRHNKIFENKQQLNFSNFCFFYLLKSAHLVFCSKQISICFTQNNKRVLKSIHFYFSRSVVRNLGYNCGCSLLSLCVTLCWALNIHFLT